MEKRVVVLHSGGLDSTAVLLYFWRNGFDVKPLFINYGQVNNERAAVLKQWETLGIAGRELEIPAIGVTESSLTNKELVADDVGSDSFTKAFIPNRNLLLLSFAYNYAISIGAELVSVGFVKEGGTTAFEDAVVDILAQVTTPAFPDSTLEFVLKAEELLQLSSGTSIEISTPFIGFTKFQMVEYFIEEDQKFLLDTTISCNEWHEETQAGCGKCRKCVLHQSIRDKVLT